MQSGTEQLGDALAAFNIEHRRLTNALNVGHALSDGAAAEVVALGLDVRDSCVLLIDLYGGALVEFLEEHRALTANAPPPPPSEASGWTEQQWKAWMADRPAHEPDWALFQRLREHQESGRSWSSRLSLGYKTSFFFIRAYQDALCRVLLVLAGQRAGGYSSMSTAMKKSASPVRLLFDQELPSYREWFKQWTALRDKLKVGTGFSFQLIDGELGVVFVGIAAPEGTHSGLSTHQTVYLSDVAAALGQTATAVTVTVERATVNLGVEERAYVERLD